MKSVFGGTDYYDENGQRIGYAVPGIGGGEDIFLSNGETGYTVESILGGKDYYGINGIRVHSMRGLLGGKDIQGDVHGYRAESFPGGEDIFLEEDS